MAWIKGPFHHALLHRAPKTTGRGYEMGIGRDDTGPVQINGGRLMDQPFIVN